MNLPRGGSPLPPSLSLIWLGVKIAVYLIIAMGSMDVVVVAYQQF